MTVSNGKSASDVLDGIFEAMAAFDGSISRLGDLEVAKQQALAALEEIIVAAKPGRASVQIWHETPSDAWEMGIDQYEQNIRQAFSNGG